MHKCVATVPPTDLLFVLPLFLFTSFHASSHHSYHLFIYVAHPYHPDTPFSISAIECLSSFIGMDLWQEIKKHSSKFITAIQLNVSDLINLDPCGKRLVQGWLAGKSPVTPSWINLLTVIRSLGLRKHSNTIEKFLYTVPPTSSIPQTKDEGARIVSETQGTEQGELRPN